MASSLISLLHCSNLIMSIPASSANPLQELLYMITIVICTFNNLEELKITLESVLDSSDVDITIINGSTSPDTRIYLDTLDRKEIRVINEPDNGIYDAFNKGWKNAQGDYICYTNSGDILINQDDYLIKSQHYLENHPECGYVYGDIIFVDQELGEIRRKSSERNFGYGMFIIHPSMVVRKSVFEQLQGFNDNYRIAGDFDFVVRMIKENITGYYMPLVVNKMDGAGVSTQQEWLSIKESRQSLLSNEMYKGRTRFAFYVRCSNYFIKGLLDMLHLNRLKLFIKRLKLQKP